MRESENLRPTPQITDWELKWKGRRQILKKSKFTLKSYHIELFGIHN